MQLRQLVVGFDEIIELTNDDFGYSGLRATSLIRLGYLGVVPESEMVGDIRVIAAARYHRLMQQLSDFLKPQ